VLTNFDLSNHYGVFSIISEKTSKNEKDKEIYEVRDMSNFKIEDFLEYLNFKLYCLHNYNHLKC